MRPAGDAMSTSAAAIVEHVAARLGMEVRAERRGLLEDAVRRHAVTRGYGDAGCLHRAMLDDRRALDEVTGALTNCESYFFRHPEHLQALARHVVPERRRAWGGPGARLRIWSAGCACGQEPYSILLALEAASQLDGVSVFATDVSAAALTEARAGVYSPWSLRGVGGSLERLLTVTGDQVVVPPAVRGRVRFAQLNLAAPVYPAVVSGTWALDVVFCRNVLIYLRPEVIEAVYQRLYSTLSPGGWLFVAPADPPPNRAAPFEQVELEGALAYRRPSAGASASRPLSLAPSRPRPAAPQDTFRDSLAAARALASSWPALAVRQTARLRDAHPGRWEVPLLLGLLHIQRGDAEAAASALRAAVALAPTQPLLHHLLAVIACRQGDSVAARRAEAMARALALQLPPDAPVEPFDGMTAADLLAVIDQDPCPESDA